MTSQGSPGTETIHSGPSATYRSRVTFYLPQEFFIPKSITNARRNKKEQEEFNWKVQGKTFFFLVHILRGRAGPRADKILGKKKSTFSR